MKITTDVNAGMRPTGSVSSRTQVQPTESTANRNSQLTTDISAKLQRDKAMIDALTIAQSSRTLVQKAMDVSARMRTIAYQAMTTGSVDTQELGNEIAGIQGTMQTYGEIVSIPVSNTAGKTVLPPEFSNEMTKMRTAAQQIASGEKADPELFTQSGSRLSAIAAKADKKISDMAASLGSSAKNLYALNSKNPVSGTADMIVNNPEMSLTVQGNINPETVKVLTTV